MSKLCLIKPQADLPCSYWKPKQSVLDAERLFSPLLAKKEYLFEAQYIRVMELASLM